MKWGGLWRMPTADEMNELLYSCIWEWTELNNTKGCLVYGIYSGNCIFIPDAGHYSDRYNNDKDLHIELWTSCLSLDLGDSGSAIYADTYRPFENMGINGGFRYSGRSIRPVCD
jgi:hypothetical protein